MAGGYFGGQINNGGTIYNMIVAPVADGQYPGGGSGGTPTTVQYKISNSADSPAATFQNEVYGFDATTAGNDAAHPMFQWAKALNIGGFTDWYIPAKNELEILYYNLKPGIATNDTGSGINPDAVPARASNYTAGTPAQTTSALFAGGSQAFTDAGYYWSSSQDTAFAIIAWGQYFVNGLQDKNFKNTICCGFARAVRRVLA
jgi:hypothetical protein